MKDTTYDNETRFTPPLSDSMSRYYRLSFYEHTTFIQRVRSWVRENVTYFVHTRDLKGFVHRGGFYCFCFAVFLYVCDYIR